MRILIANIIKKAVTLRGTREFRVKTLAGICNVFQNKFDILALTLVEVDRVS